MSNVVAAPVQLSPIAYCRWWRCEPGEVATVQGWCRCSAAGRRRKDGRKWAVTGPEYFPPAPARWELAAH